MRNQKLKPLASAIALAIALLLAPASHAAPRIQQTNYCGLSTWITVADSGYVSYGDERWLDVQLQEQVDSTYHTIYCGSLRSLVNAVIDYNAGVYWCNPGWTQYYHNVAGVNFQMQNFGAGQCTPANPATWHYQTIGNAQAQNVTTSYRATAYFSTGPGGIGKLYVNTPWYQP